MPVLIAYVAVTARDIARARVLDAFNRPGAFNNRIGWQTDTTSGLLAIHRNAGRTASKLVRVPIVGDDSISGAITRTGMDYANLKHNANRETGPLPHGQEWATDSEGNSLFPYIIVSADGATDYVRIYADIRTIKPVYFIDGVEVDKAEYVELMKPSAVKPRPIKNDDNGQPIYTLTIAPKLENIVL